MVVLVALSTSLPVMATLLPAVIVTAPSVLPTRLPVLVTSVTSNPSVFLVAPKATLNPPPPYRPDFLTVFSCSSLCVFCTVSSVRLLPAASTTSPVLATCAPCDSKSLPAAICTVSPLSVVVTATLSCHSSCVVVVLLLNVPFFFLVMSCTASCCSLAASRLTSLPAARVMPPSLLAADAAVRVMSLPACIARLPPALNSVPWTVSSRVAVVCLKRLRVSSVSLVSTVVSVLALMSLPALIPKPLPASSFAATRLTSLPALRIRLPPAVSACWSMVCVVVVVVTRVLPLRELSLLVWLSLTTEATLRLLPAAAIRSPPAFTSAWRMVRSLPAVSCRLSPVLMLVRVATLPSRPVVGVSERSLPACRAALPPAAIVTPCSCRSLPAETNRSLPVVTDTTSPPRSRPLSSRRALGVRLRLLPAISAALPPACTRVPVRVISLPAINCSVLLALMPDRMPTPLMALDASLTRLLPATNATSRPWIWP